MQRREFLQGVAGVCALGTIAGGSAEGSEKMARVKWQVGCFNRPWGAWSYDVALEQMREAGFHTTGILGDHKGETFLDPEATPEYLDALKKRIESHGLKASMGRLRIQHNTPIDEAIQKVHQQIDNARHVGVKYVMALGTSNLAEYDHFYKVMQEASSYAAKKKVELIFKPHGGCSADSDDILRCLEKVNHPNFRLWYDAGNIIHYTGKDPVKEAERVAKYVSGFCAKDCAQLHGDVMLQFGTGKVDFVGVFRVLKEAGFKGPVMIECCAGKTVEEVTANAIANRVFLENLFATL